MCIALLPDGAFKERITNFRHQCLMHHHSINHDTGSPRDQPIVIWFKVKTKESTTPAKQEMQLGVVGINALRWQEILTSSHPSSEPTVIMLVTVRGPTYELSIVSKNTDGKVS